MEYIVTANEMRSYDRHTIQYYGMESLVLMERAADCVCQRIISRKDCNKVLVLCGSGNNGGDGFAIGRILHTKNYSVKIISVGTPEKMTPETARQYEIARRYQIPIEEYKESTYFLEDTYDCVVDALLGISLSRPVEGAYADVLRKVNGMEGFKIAVDIPSGICPDTGRILGCAFMADETVTFGFKKAGLLFLEGKVACGNLICADIGITEKSFLHMKPVGISYGKDDLSLIPRRNPASHKGSFGKVLLIAGSKEIGGACLLSALSLYRSGCGYVKVFTHERNRDLIIGNVPEAIVSTYGDAQLDMNMLQSDGHQSTLIVMGPGMGKTEEAKKIVEYVLTKTDTPLVLDADALNIVSEDEKLQELLKEQGCRRTVILTPHLLELKRFAKIEIQDFKKNILQNGLAIANQYHCVLVCKDNTTIVFDGRNKQLQYYINQSGNDGLATAGSGDILAGLIGGMLGKGMDGMEAACMGVYLHGVCSDEIDKTGSRSYMKPTDLIEQLDYLLE